MVLSKEEKVTAQNLKKRLQFCKESAGKLCQTRKQFISDHRTLLEPFCGNATLDKLTKNQVHESVFVPNEVGFLKQSPAYITVPVRDYQLEGINRMYDWYLRGVGGILADEM